MDIQGSVAMVTGANRGLGRHFAAELVKRGATTDLLDGDFANIRLDMETIFFGTLRTTRAFVPVIEANGGGGVLNVLSVLSWVHVPPHESYAAAKAASWAMTDALRLQVAPKGIQVTALHVGYMDTDLTAGIDSPMSDPAVVAALTLDGVQAGAFEVLAELSKDVRAGLSAELTALYPQLNAPQA